jgi:hypothetical protein
MSSTNCATGDLHGTLTPLVYIAEEINKNASKSFNDWLFKGRNTDELAFTHNPSIGVIVGFKVNKNGLPEYESRIISTKENSVIEKINARIFYRLSFPKHWLEEDVVPPNVACKTKAFELCRYLFEKHNLIPDRIAPTREEGIYLAFDTDSGDKTLIIEVYNDLEAALIVNDNIAKAILFSEYISNLEFSTAINCFNG